MFARAPVQVVLFKREMQREKTERQERCFP